MNDVVNPNPFHYAEQIDRCTLLGITVFRTTAARFYAYLICLTHVPYIMMAVYLIPFTTASESSQNLRTRMFKF